MVMIICFVAMIFVVIQFTIQGPQIAAKNAELNSVKADVEKAKTENAELAEKKKRVGTKEYIEQMAREKLGLVKKNEIIFFDVDK